MRGLGIDPSLLSMGWCVWESNPDTPSEHLVASGHEGTLRTHVPVARFIHFRSLVADILKRYRVDVVGIESPAYGGDSSFSEVHFGLMMFSLESVFEARKDCVLFDPVTVKRLVTGNAGASKQDMQKFVQIDRLSTDLVQSDEADAYCIAREAVRFFLLRQGKIVPEDLSEYERRIFLEKIRKKRRGPTSIVKRTAHIFRENSRFFEFSRVPQGSISLPEKSKIEPSLLEWLEKEQERL